MNTSSAPLCRQPDLHALRSLTWRGVCGERVVRGACGSHIGLRRRNEDAFFVSARHNLLAVADGMGAHPGGHIASDLAVRALYPSIEGAALEGRGGCSRTQMNHAIMSAHLAVRARHPRDPERPMATTLVGLWLIDGHAVFGHVGDSRAYRLRDELLCPLTLDHNALGEAVRRGIDPAAISHIPGHLLSRAVGLEAAVRPDVGMCNLRPGDRYLLCTDGITEVLDDALIGEILSDGRCPDRIMRDLVEEALLSGSADNITAGVLLVR